MTKKIAKKWAKTLRGGKNVYKESPGGSLTCVMLKRAGIDISAVKLSRINDGRKSK